jgi:hypothetical protein
MPLTLDRSAGGGSLYRNRAAVLTYLHEKDFDTDANHLVRGDTENDKVIVAVVLPPEFLKEHGWKIVAVEEGNQHLVFIRIDEEVTRSPAMRTC